MALIGAILPSFGPVGDEAPLHDRGLGLALGVLADRQYLLRRGDVEARLKDAGRSVTPFGTPEATPMRPGR